MKFGARAAALITTESGAMAKQHGKAFGESEAPRESFGRHGLEYTVTPAQRDAFHERGFVHLPAFLSEDELALLDDAFGRFVRREIHVEGRDFCDMSGEYSRAAEDFAIVNIMLPRVYEPALQASVYERVAAHVAAQLQGEDMQLDYDQIVAKRPGRDDARFEWHQDLAYWPATRDTRTASFWLALDDTTEDNGCVCFVPASHREPRLRPHGAVAASRDESHTIAAQLAETDQVVPATIQRGDVTVHHERTLHGSGGNRSQGWRRGWVLAYRARSCVEEERAMGFTHSHNDDPSLLERLVHEEKS